MEAEQLPEVIHRVTDKRIEKRRITCFAPLRPPSGGWIAGFFIYGESGCWFNVSMTAKKRTMESYVLTLHRLLGHRNVKIKTKKVYLEVIR